MSLLKASRLCGLAKLQGSNGAHNDLFFLFTRLRQGEQEGLLDVKLAQTPASPGQLEL